MQPKALRPEDYFVSDEKARDYLPRMYGAANYPVIDDVAQLRLKASDLYRRLTTR